MDTSSVGHIAAELMEAIAHKYDDAPVVIGAIMLLVEVRADPDASESDFSGPFEDFAATIESQCSDDRLWIQVGLLTAVIEGKKSWWRDEDRDDEEDDDTVD